MEAIDVSISLDLGNIERKESCLTFNLKIIMFNEKTFCHYNYKLTNTNNNK